MAASPKKKAEAIWKLFEPFQGYGFNKAHAASYGKVAYQTAYMKANFPEIYMSAVLSAESGDMEKIAEIVAECKRMGIPVLPPDVNESFSQFTVVKDKGIGYRAEDTNYTLNPKPFSRIRFGLVTIKNFGQGVSTAIIDERKKGGQFKSLADFLGRVKDRNLNKKSLEALIKVGRARLLRRGPRSAARQHGSHARIQQARAPQRTPTRILSLAAWRTVLACRRFASKRLRLRR